MALLEYYLKIRNIGFAELAEILGISRMALYRKRRGIVQFKHDEMQTIVKTLDLSADEAFAIFFANEVA